MARFDDQLKQVLEIRLSRAPLFTAITLVTLAVGPVYLITDVTHLPLPLSAVAYLAC